MRKFKFLSVVLIFCGLMSFSHSAHALWPTFDFLGFAARIKQAKETVSQFGFIKRGVETYSNISNTVGSARSSVSKFITENTSRIEGQLKAFEKESKLMADAKKTYKDNKKMLADARSEYDNIKSEVDSGMSDYNSYKSQYNQFTSNVGGSSSIKETVKNTVKEQIKGTEAESVINQYNSTKKEVEDTAEKAKNSPKDLLKDDGKAVSSSQKKYGEDGKEAEDKSISGQMKKFRENSKQTIDQNINNYMGQGTQNQTGSGKTNVPGSLAPQSSYSFSEPMMFADQQDEDDDDDFFAYNRYNGAFLVPKVVSEVCHMQPQDFANEEAARNCFLLIAERISSKDRATAEAGREEFGVANAEVVFDGTAYVLKKRMENLDAPAKAIAPLDKELGSSPDLRSDTQSIAIAGGKSIEYIADGNDLLGLSAFSEGFRRLDAFNADAVRRYKANRI